MAARSNRHWQPLAAQQVSTKTGIAALAGGGVIVATGTPTVLGTAAVAGGGVLHSSGVRSETGTAAVTGGGVLASTGTPIVLGTAALVGGGVLAASSSDIVLGTADLEGGGVLTATGQGPATSHPPSGGKPLHIHAGPKSPPKTWWWAQGLQTEPKLVTGTAICDAGGSFKAIGTRSTTAISTAGLPYRAHAGGEIWRVVATVDVPQPRRMIHVTTAPPTLEERIDRIEDDLAVLLLL